MELSYAADQDTPMLLLPEIEAAEALTALARCSAEEPTRPSSEDEAVAASRVNKCTIATSAFISGATDRDAPTKLGSTWWNSGSKLRRNLTEAEKEARRLRRILANRESARQTVRRRQAIHMELTRKAVNLSVENENLKKEKELAVEASNSLKNRNKFLKLQAANVKKAESREPKSSQAEKPTTSSPPSLYNQPSFIPFLWPSVISSNVIQYQYPSHSDVTSISESSLQHRDTSSSHPGPEISSGRTGPGSPLFVFPLPWVLPYPSHGPMLHSCSDTEKRTNETPSAHKCSISPSSDNLFVLENSELSSEPNMLIKACTCADSTHVESAIGARLTYPVISGGHCTGLHSGVAILTPEKLSCIRPAGNSSEDDTSGPSAMDSVLETLPKKNAELVFRHHKKPENVFSAITARRRRKELMMLRNVK